MTPDPSREIEQVIEEMREGATGDGYGSIKASGGDIRKWADRLALLTAASPVSPDVRKWAAEDHLDIYVPGVQRCPTCEFELTSQTLFMRSGDIGMTRAQALGEELEPCPNDGTPMVKVRWSERAQENQRSHIKLIDDILALTGAKSLPEALDGLKDAALASSPVSGEKEEAMTKHAYEADRETMFLAADGSMMCETHPGREWPHDDCAGPGTPWALTGKTQIQNALTASAEVVSQPPQERWQPVETAPKDKPFIGGYWATSTPGSPWCSDRCFYQEPHPDMIEGYHCVTLCGRPTHWLPFDPPASGEGSTPSPLKEK